MLKEKEMVAVATGMLATLLAWECGIEAIKKKAKKYFEKFFELSDVDESVKREVIRAFYNCASHLPDSFDAIVKAAMSYSKERKT